MRINRGGTFRPDPQVTYRPLSSFVLRPGQRRQRRATRRRLVSVFRRGWITIPVALVNQASLPLGAFLPEPWPQVPALEPSRVVSDPQVHHDATA